MIESFGYLKLKSSSFLKNAYLGVLSSVPHLIPWCISLRTTFNFQPGRHCIYSAKVFRGRNETKV